MYPHAGSAWHHRGFSLPSNLNRRALTEVSNRSDIALGHPVSRSIVYVDSMSTQDGASGIPFEICNEQQNLRLLELPPSLLELITSKSLTK